MVSFGEFIAGFTIGAPSIPVISNVTAEPYAASAMAETLAKQIGHSVRWLDSILFLLKHGATTFEEVGPGSVLTKLIAQIKKKL